MRIPSASVARISNATVLERAIQLKLSKRIKHMQLDLLGQVITTEKKKPLKEVAFHKNTLRPETSVYIRRLGRPRQNWTEQLISQMYRITRANERFSEAMQSMSNRRMAIARL